MKINEKICPIHGLLPNAYFMDTDREYYFILSCNFRRILAVKSYSKYRPVTKNISCRTLNGEQYYRLLDDESLRTPITLGKRDIYKYFCPICKFENSNNGLGSVLDKIISKLSSELNYDLGFSGSYLIGGSEVHDYDIAIYNIEDIKNTVKHIDKFKRRHKLKELTSWRRLVYNESIICLYLRQRYPPFYLERLQWPLNKNLKLKLMKLKVINDKEGFAFPAYYKCVTLMDGSKIKQGEYVIFASTRPGHSGLLKCGDEFTIQCYEFNINGVKVVLADPCNSWAEVQKSQIKGEPE